MGPFNPDADALADLDHHWGSAYVVAHPEPDVWVAQRRDTRETIRAQSADELFAAILADYSAKPVPR